MGLCRPGAVVVVVGVVSLRALFDAPPMPTGDGSLVYCGAYKVVGFNAYGYCLGEGDGFSSFGSVQVTLEVDPDRARGGGGDAGNVDIVGIG